MTRQKEIFNKIAIAIIAVIPYGTPFKYAILEIKRLVGSVGFTGFYITENDAQKWLDIFSFNLESELIQELYKITQTMPPIHKNWNRAKYTLFSEGKVEIEYIWDQSLQDELDRLNEDIYRHGIGFFKHPHP